MADDDFSSDDFEDGKCPKCGSDDIDEEHNPKNFLFLNEAGYFLNFPFGANYRCNKCSTESSDECFVATAVYGDANAPQVNILRKVRDEVLMECSVGRAFVKFYYSGAGKKAADFIRNHVPSAIPAIRKGLDAIVERYSPKK